ncbi:cation efflux family-domain-containing protein [Aspergillus arachidicola]|uniref:Cation efflux family-domain-containing protein n=1 Tax=Aspergillus arachidicola TaxID=656916 RepID=A0A5N6YLV9_9EURO|nr:cation efflux family-domain-containing protein [Aspergillus arachidicola]
MSDSFHRTIILTQNRYLQRRSRQKICPLAGSELASLGHFLMESFFSPSVSVFSYSLSSDLSAHKVCITVCILEGKLTGSLVVESPKLVLIIGCVGLALNILSASFLHEHDHGHDNISGGNLDASAESGINEAYAFHTGHRHNNLQAQKKGYDLGLLGVFIHVVGDAFNNVGVIISALIIWLTHSASRYYVDPAISMAIALMIMGTSIPLVRNSGLILLNSVPKGIDLSDVKHDLELLPEVSSIHELHAWRLNQEKALASVHVGLPDIRISEFVKLAKTMNECFHSYGIHSAIVQPELVQTVEDTTMGTETKSESCQITCGSSCELLTCCG